MEKIKEMSDLNNWLDGFTYLVREHFRKDIYESGEERRAQNSNSD